MVAVAAFVKTVFAVVGASPPKFVLEQKIQDLCLPVAVVVVAGTAQQRTLIVTYFVDGTAFRSLCIPGLGVGLVRCSCATVLV